MQILMPFKILSIYFQLLKRTDGNPTCVKWIYTDVVSLIIDESEWK